MSMHGEHNYNETVIVSLTYSKQHFITKKIRETQKLFIFSRAE